MLRRLALLATLTALLVSAPATRAAATRVVQPSTQVRYLSDVSQASGPSTHGPATINGHRYARSLGVASTSCTSHPWAGPLVFTLDGGINRFQSIIGLNDEAPVDLKWTFGIAIDGREAGRRTVGFGESPTVTVDVTGGRQLELWATVAVPSETNDGYCPALFPAWGDPRIVSLRPGAGIPTSKTAPKVVGTSLFDAYRTVWASGRQLNVQRRVTPMDESPHNSVTAQVEADTKDHRKAVNVTVTQRPLTSYLDAMDPIGGHGPNPAQSSGGSGLPPTLDGTPYPRFLYVGDRFTCSSNGMGSTDYNLGRRGGLLKGVVGLIDTAKPRVPLVLTVKLDGREVFRSGPLDVGAPPLTLRIDLGNALRLTLIAQTSDGGVGCDDYGNGGWGEMRILRP